MADFYEDYEENIMRAQQGKPVPDSGSGYGRGVATGIGIASAIAAALYVKKHGGVKKSYQDLANLIRGSEPVSYIKNKWKTFTKNRAAKAELKEAGIDGYAGAAERIRAISEGLRAERGLTKEGLKKAEDLARGYPAFRDKAATAVRDLDELASLLDTPDAKAQVKNIADSLRQ